MNEIKQNIADIKRILKETQPIIEENHKLYKNFKIRFEIAKKEYYSKNR